MAHDRAESEAHPMHTEIHLARGIVEGRIQRGQGAAQTRDLTLVREAARRLRRTTRRER
mgnify:CR=1 FL=1